MSRSLPPRANLEYLRTRAKRRLASLRLSDPDTRLAAAQRAVALDYGFSSWRALVEHLKTSRKRPPRLGAHLPSR